MATTALNPYTMQKSQLGLIEAGLKSLKNDKSLQHESEFSVMYGAVEKHHRELRLAHLTGKAKDVMEQAARDTKFYNILIKMLCEIRCLQGGKQKETLKKVHSWYLGNRHTLASGPKFGKENMKAEKDEGPSEGFMVSRTPVSRQRYCHSRSATSLSSKRSHKIKGENKENKRSVSDFQQYMTDTPDEASLKDGLSESVAPPSEPASSRMSTALGTDFMTHRFMMDLPSSKLSWHLESPGPKSLTDWEGTEFERIGESSLSHPTFDGHFLPSHPSVPYSSPQSEAESPRSNLSGASSGVDVGSTDMMDFHSDMRRRLSHNPTSSAGIGLEMSEDQSSAVLGLQKRMVHSIASLVNPHAKLAETEAIKQEQQLMRQQMSATPFRMQPSRSQSSAGGTPIDLQAHIPVLRAVSVSSNRPASISAFNSFRDDHLYGQDILSKLKFVGRSGTALDVRYAAHAQAEMPERHTRDVIRLYSSLSQQPPAAPPYETQIHTQSLEEFYEAAEHYYPTRLPKHGSARTRSAPAPRMKSGKMPSSGRAEVKTAGMGGKGRRNTEIEETKSSAKRQPKQSAQKSANVRSSGVACNEEDEVLYSAERPTSAVRLETVVGLIDHVKDEMNYFKEKLAPAPMAGFRQPASTGVSNKPLSRPGSTASRASRPRSSNPPPRRSPSPQARPGTPMESEEILMGEAEVPGDTYRSVILSTRPHSATLNKAVDWRGKVTSEAPRIKTKLRFGGHSYVKKSKPSLRSVGSQSAGKRPKTAPVPIKEKWNTKEKETEIALPEVRIKNFPDIVPTYPSYPIKKQIDKPRVLITITECDKNERVPQAVSNTMTQVDDRDMDRIMTIQHLLGSSDSRYGSMGSLFLDEDFLRSFNARYTTRSSMSHLTTDSQNREFVSFVGPTPRLNPTDIRPGTKTSSKKLEVKQIPEESVEDGGGSTDTEVPPLDLYTKEEDQEERTCLEETGTVQLEVSVTDQEDLQVVRKDTTEVSKGEGVEEEVSVRELVQVSTEDVGDDVHIEVTALPAAGFPTSPPAHGNATLKSLSTSDTWHYSSESKAKGDLNTYPSGTQDVDFHKQLAKPKKPVTGRPRPFSAFDSRTSGHWAKSIVKPDNYCFECIPEENMTSKVGRSAGRTPGGPQTPAGQVLRMARRQNEYFKKAPPLRTPPSIPSGHQMLIKQSPRQGQQYSSELEHHARKVNSPRHFMEQDGPRRSNSEVSGKLLRGSPFVELRKDLCRSAPASFQHDADDIMGSLSVISLRAPRAQTAPNSHIHTKPGLVDQLAPHIEEGVEGEGENPVPVAKLARVTPRTRQSLTHTGRPIPQVKRIPDPDAENQAALKQREAAAAVDIQRIFRGYVCRNAYRKLVWENREHDEDKQTAIMENKKQYRQHQGRMTSIYNRPPLDPALLQWAHDFKAVQGQHAERRQAKMNNLAEQMLANEQEAKSTLEVIGPHVEIYDIYHPKDFGPSKRDMHKASVTIQKYVRGFMVRKRFEKLRRKAVFCGTTWELAVKDYKQMLLRVQRWHGIEKPATPFTLHHMEEYMDNRRRFESQFDKKAFGGDLEMMELDAFFRECDLYPSAAEIEEGLDVITNGQALRKATGLKKADALNLMFYIYVPPGAGLENTRQSTWMNPIINGQEARKMIGSEFVETAPLKPCAAMVMKSRRERREKEEEERERQRLASKAGGSDSDSDDSITLKRSSVEKTRKMLASKK
ncbi:uncharacterized protein LOC128227574 isoform X4 [Mya arenaria]|uniref:uncharacterized protein LOC128227574 isoform X4 n=1 Tax=Mya arenaria TaxID=6604 RepID=UPI0022E781C7|nr:uncharacterized protein LOC128227574 isoform X4 [Mya arenaria]